MSFGWMAWWILNPVSWSDRLWGYRNISSEGGYEDGKWMSWGMHGFLVSSNEFEGFPKIIRVRWAQSLTA